MVEDRLAEAHWLGCLLSPARAAIRHDELLYFADGETTKVETSHSVDILQPRRHRGAYQKQCMKIHFQRRCAATRGLETIASPAHVDGVSSSSRHYPS